MAWELSRQEVKNIFTTALTRVANFNSSDPELEENTFENFHDFHKIVFLNELKRILNNTFKLYKGKQYCYNITLNENIINSWKSFADCIDYIADSQRILHVENNVNL